MTKIMLVEDDKNLSAIYRDRLLAEGYDIVSAHDGEEALAMAVNEKPNLIISDIMMPKISGFDMLDILRSTPETKNTKVIMMTALSQVEDQQRAAKLGADKYLVKSQVTLDDVARVVREVLESDGVTASSVPEANTEQPNTPDAPQQPSSPPQNEEVLMQQQASPVTEAEPAPAMSMPEYSAVNTQQNEPINSAPTPEVNNVIDQMQSTAEEKSEIENEIEQLANNLPSQPEQVSVDTAPNDLAVSPEIMAATENPASVNVAPENQAKPDIMKLYEEEMAKEASVNQTQDENQPAQTETETAPQPNDPHSISL